MPLVMETVSNMFHRKGKTKTKTRTPRRKFSSINEEKKIPQTLLSFSNTCK